MYFVQYIDTKMAEQRQAALRESSDKQAAIFSEENASLKARVRKLEAKHATDVETAAKALYYLLPGNTQGSPANYPWQDGGNSHMQMLARNLASAALASRSLPAEAAGSDIEWAIRHVRAADKELGSVLIGSAPDPQGRGPAFLFAQLRDATEWLIKQIAAQPVPSKEVSSEKCDCSICYICPRHAVARLLGKSEAPSAEPVGDSGKASVAIGYVVQHDAKGGNFFTDTSSFEHMRGVYGDAAKLVSAIPAANEQATKDGS